MMNSALGGKLSEGEMSKSSSVTVHEAKTHLSRLLARVEAGEEIVIARGKKPVGKLVPIDQRLPMPRQPGRLKGIIDIGPEFFEPLPDEELEAWGV
jgi:prevent-host-death family protein